MDFKLDERLTSSCCTLIDWPLSRILLKNNSNYPWLILVPRIAEAREIYELSPSNRHQLIEEISLVSSIIQEQFTPNKINIGALGNQVAQLHIHVIGRFKTDPLWPAGIWQADQIDQPYPKEKLTDLSSRLVEQLSKAQEENKLDFSL